MSHRVDATVKPEEAALVDPGLDRIPRKPEPKQLRSGNDAVLKPRQLAHRPLTWTT